MLILDDGGSVNVGDAWSLGAALTSAVYIIRLGRAGEQDATHLASATLVFTTLSCWVTAFAIAQQTGRSVIDDAGQLLEGNAMQLLYLSVAVTAATGWLQVYGQAAVSPEQASVIYSLDAAYAPCFAWLLLGEHLQRLGRLGVALVVVSNLLMRLERAPCWSPRSSPAVTGDGLVSPYVPLLGRGTEKR
jgi:drug/metabolite transporter (DMT)-like permease